MSSTTIAPDRPPPEAHARVCGLRLLDNPDLSPKMSLPEPDLLPAIDFKGLG
jgi:hypothetical protein